MKTRPFGPTGVQLPVIGQGTWRMEGDDRQACIETLRAGLGAGMTHVDTAELYGRGLVEELVGEAIQGRRDQLYLVSKVMPVNATFDGTQRACEKSLRRLGTDVLDLYLLHWPGNHPLEETLRAFAALKKAGKIRAFGVSNFDVADLEEAVSLAGEGAIACNQVLYHLEERAIERAVIPWCKQHRIAVMGYSPFGAGNFVSPRSPGGKVLTQVAQELGATERQVALAFLTRDPDVFAIPKTTQPRHAQDNAAAGDLVLPADAMHRLDAAFPAVVSSGLPTI